MIIRYGVMIAAIVACLTLPATGTFGQEKFKLKPGATGKVCLTCHVTFQDKLKSPSVHTPVKRGDCSGCHNPHTSSHGKMLSTGPSEVCSRCHAMVPDKTASAHKVVVEGKCVLCHDTHASPFKNNLLKNGNELCFGCHAGIAAAVKKATFKHHPVEKGCLSCHNPHASQRSASLLKEAVPSLCVSCHKTGSPAFAKQHMNYPVATSVCTSCHNPHGSSKVGILYDTVHKPVLSRMCNQCHDEPTSAAPFRTKKEGYELCQACHSNMINDTFSKDRVHWPLVSKKGCMSCHTPHASAESSLLKGPRTTVCRSCHDDTFERQARSAGKHAPVENGDCNSCHAAHSSSANFLLKKPVIDQCGTCHDWKLHSMHPMGDKARDPRNKNLSVQCLSCHSSHGTPYEKLALFASLSEMCTQCHAKYGR